MSTGGDGLFFWPLGDALAATEELLGVLLGVVPLGVVFLEVFLGAAALGVEAFGVVAFGVVALGVAALGVPLLLPPSLLLLLTSLPFFFLSSEFSFPVMTK